LGDIHQPLHDATRIDTEFPDGDIGGNAFPLPNHYSVNNLHSLWDSAMYEYHETTKMVKFLNSFICSIAIGFRYICIT